MPVNMLMRKKDTATMYRKKRKNQPSSASPSSSLPSSNSPLSMVDHRTLGQPSRVATTKSVTKDHGVLSKL